MIAEDLKLSHEVEMAIEDAGVDVSDSESPIIDAVGLLKGALRYHARQRA